ncbi:MAG: tryptophan--tRNA ligase [Patescibacteria group bacterium]
MRIFSGIQPTGVIHLGNYFGAIKNWVELQKIDDCIFCIVNYHAITIPKNSKSLEEDTYNTVAFFLAVGIDSKKSIIFIQSQVPEHTELCWILNTVSRIPELERMTQFKDKSKDHRMSVNVGLFDYPVLMAADILLYKTDIVPVGDDQKQHVELTQLLARRFNSLFGETLKIPQVFIKKEGARVMGLDNPSKKMSKSAKSPYNYISFDDSAEVIKDKIKKAVTDSGKEIKKSPQKPAISNLLNIYSLISKKSISDIEKIFKNKSYKEFKEELGNELIKFILPLQKKKKEILKDRKYLEKILENGKARAEVMAQKTMREVKQRMGII